MFSFLNSGILALAVTAVIPLLIYLFAKKKPQKVIFSSIRHIIQTQKSEKKRINLQDILLLILRTAIIILVIFAISRPSIKLPWVQSASNHPKTAIAIILDNSYSMNYLVDTETELEKAKQIALKINSFIAEGDVVLIKTLDINWNELNSYLSYGKIDSEKIENIKITAISSNFKKIIETADEQLKKSHYTNREIYVISDLQEKNIPSIEEQLYYIPVSNVTMPSNISCQSANFHKDIVENKYSIRAELVNHSDFIQKDVVYSLFLNGVTQSEKVTDLNPGQRKKIEFELELTEADNYSGFVGVRDERLTYDNRSYFSFYFTPSPQVTVLTDKKIPASLNTFLSIYTNDIQIANLNDYNSSMLLASDNIIINFSNHNEKIEYLLQQLRKEDKNYILLADKTIEDEYIDFIETHFNIKFLEYNSSSVLVNRINHFHPISEVLVDKKIASISNFWKVSSAANTIIGSENAPLVIENDGNILFLFEISESNSRFLVDSAFPILINNSLQYTQTLNQYDRQIEVGKPIYLENHSIILPDNSVIETSGVKYYPKYPGIYESDGRQYAVNLNYEESNFSPMGISENIEVLEENWENKIFSSRYGYEVWKILLILVLVLFLWEMLLVKKREKR
ncbi:MAG: BatA domain-containing protein [Candidatus Cloacimonadota bacterium]|nr:BatA domain-containing protein [Candidatus Cloacimonadota bacterium]